MTVDESRFLRAVQAVVPTVQEEILRIGAHWQYAQYQLLHLIVELEQELGRTGPAQWNCTRWVADALDIELCTAREWMRVGRALQKLPLTDAAFEAGLSYSKVRTLTRVATPESERQLLDIAYETPAGRLGTALAAWCAERENPAETQARQHAARSVTWTVEPDGMIHGRFRLPPVTGTQLTHAIDARTMRTALGHASADASFERWPSMAQQRADALVELLTKAGSGFVTEILILVGPTGATFPDGTPIPWPELERIAPEAFVRALVHDADARPVNASARRRNPTVRQQRVVSARAEWRCVDCGSAEFLEYDHEPPFDTSGHTVVDELRPRCRNCHRARHAQGP